MRLQVQCKRAYSKRYPLRLLTLVLLLLAATSLCISATTLPASSQTTTTEPTTTTTTEATTTTTVWAPCVNPLTDEAWAACRTQHDVENVRADVIFGGALLIVLTAAIFVSRLFHGAN